MQKLFHWKQRSVHRSTFEEKLPQTVSDLRSDPCPRSLAESMRTRAASRVVMTLEKTGGALGQSHLRPPETKTCMLLHSSSNSAHLRNSLLPMATMDAQFTLSM